MMTQKGIQQINREVPRSPTLSRCRRNDDSSNRTVRRSPTRNISELQKPQTATSSYASSSKSVAPGQDLSLSRDLREEGPTSPLLPSTSPPPTLARARTIPLSQTSLDTRSRPTTLSLTQSGGSTVLIARQTLPNPYLRWLLPDHRYLGPLAPPLGTPPVDQDDAIARDQVLSYLSARCESDIRLADRTALVSFAKNLLTAFNWHSGVLLAHLALKYFLETLFGVKFLVPLVDNSRRAIAQYKNTNPVLQRNSTSENTQKAGVSPSALPPLLTTIPSLPGTSRSNTVNPSHILMRIEKQMTVMGERMNRLERAITRSQSPSR